MSSAVSIAEADRTKLYAKEYDDLNGRYNFHKSVSTRNTRIFKVVSGVMQWSLPILSGLATVLAGFKYLDSAAITSAIAAILATVNSTVHPRSRYNHYVRWVNRFYVAHTCLTLRKDQILEDTRTSVEEKHARMFNFLMEENEKLQKLIEEYNSEQTVSVVTPEQTVSQRAA